MRKIKKMLIVGFLFILLILILMTLGCDPSRPKSNYEVCVDGCGRLSYSNQRSACMADCMVAFSNKNLEYE